jgi:heme/copper-type cytochrome/quinol oxidase subunit 3
VTERPRNARRPGPALVVWSSIVLFAVLFALFTYQLSASQPAAPRPVVVHKVLKRRVITTIVPTPGRNTVSSSGGSLAESSTPGYAPVTTGAS